MDVTSLPQHGSARARHKLAIASSLAGFLTLCLRESALPAAFPLLPNAIVRCKFASNRCILQEQQTRREAPVRRLSTFLVYAEPT